MVVFDALLAVMVAEIPSLRAKPPPLAPIRMGSVMGLPSASVVQISKKLDMAAGDTASEEGKVLFLGLGAAGTLMILQTRKRCFARRHNGRR